MFHLHIPPRSGPEGKKQAIETVSEQVFTEMCLINQYLQKTKQNKKPQTKKLTDIISSSTPRICSMFFFYNICFWLRALSIYIYCVWGGCGVRVYVFKRMREAQSK